MTRQEKREKEAKDRVGMTIKNFYLLDYRCEQKYGKNLQVYLIRCLLCGNEKWMHYNSIKSPDVYGCGCYQKKRSTKDIIGKQFGRLTVISSTEERASNGVIMWICECTCGNQTKVSSSNLKGGSVRSCGCLVQERRFLNAYSAIVKGERKNIDPKDQIGMTIKNLKLLDFKYDKGSYYYFIHCTWCGKEKWKEYYSIVNSKTDSCGCQRKDFGQLDLAGQQFGRLTAIRPTEKRSQRSIIWQCECSCGENSEVRSTDLLGGHTQSCGCLQAERAVEVANDLAEKVGVERTKLNALTMRVPTNNTSGVRGVSWDKESQKWRVSIGFQGKTINLGRFESYEDAVAARKAAEDKYYKPMLEKYKDRLNPKQLAKLNK